MITLTIILALLAKVGSAQSGLQYPSCTSGLPYIASNISRTFDVCVPAFAYGASFSYPSNPYPTNSAACVNLCTSSCVAANWALGNNCQLALGSLLYVSTGSYWNPTWTAYVLRTTAPTTSTTSRTTVPTILTISNPIISSFSTPTSAISTTFTYNSRSTSPASQSAFIPLSSPSSSSVQGTGTVASRPSLQISSTTISSELSSLACPFSNGTIYNDTLGAQFSIYCGFDLYDTDPELRTVQPDFQSCIDDCDKRFTGKCPGVTWISDKSWCYFKPSTASLRPTIDTLWSAVKLPDPDGMKCPEVNGTIYTDGIYTDMLVDQYLIYCGFELLDPYSTDSRRSTQLTFDACINDCHENDDCKGVTWRPNGEDQRWCYHKSRSAVVRQSGLNYWSAQKIGKNLEAGNEVNGPLSLLDPASAISSFSTPISSSSAPSASITVISSPIGLASITTSTRTTTSGSLPSPIQPACPGGNQTIYTSGDGSTWRLECNLDYLGNDWYQVQTNSFKQCIDTCASRGPSCPAVVMVPTRNPNCYLKNGIPSAANILRQPFQCDTAVRLSNGVI